MGREKASRWEGNKLSGGKEASHLRMAGVKVSLQITMYNKTSIAGPV